MIRHIVFFRFKENVDRDSIEEFASALLALKGTISQVKEIAVAFDVGGKNNSYDLVLNTLFDSMNDVETYAVHPEHVKVLDSVRRLCADTAKVDYEVDGQKQ